MPHDEQELVEAMAALLGDQRVLAGSAAKRAYDCDAYTVDRNAPGCIVLPESTEEVQAVVRWCIGHETPYTP
ncbi:MAG: FAD-binding oxidoreductase, partial [Armatimonadetes bacterium]|nr:FAD-binding oxidoreductase [Armatimonadota bacterium]